MTKGHVTIISPDISQDTEMSTIVQPPKTLTAVSSAPNLIVNVDKHKHGSPLLCQTHLIENRKVIDSHQLLVLKVGTSTILETSTATFCLSNLGKFVDCICNIKEKGYQVVLVSSGAVGAGVIHMKLKERPTTLQGKQAASAVGQCRMMRLYEDLFSIREQKVGQLILTRTDLMDRSRFINFKQTLKELLRLDVIPIINENDSIATTQLRFGDNDTLASYVAVALRAQWLFLLTDVDCLYTANPRSHPDAKPIPYVGRLDDIYKLLDEKDNCGTSWGSGGMRTKIVAAKIATATGIHTALCCGKHPERILDIISFAETYGQTPEEWEAALNQWYRRKSSSGSLMKISKSESSLHAKMNMADLKGLQHHHHQRLGKSNDTASECGDSRLGHESFDELVTVNTLSDMPYLATIFAAIECTQKIRDQRRWILSLPVRGRIHIDDGAAKAIIEGKKSLFAAGIVNVEGMFFANEAVSLVLVKPDNVLASAHASAVSLIVVSPPSEPSSSPQLSATDTKIEALEITTETKTTVRHKDVTSQQRSRSHHPPSHSSDHEQHLKLSDKRHHGKHETGKHENPKHEDPMDKNEDEIARCLVDFSSVELNKIKGLRSDKFREVLGYECDQEVSHRHNIIFVNPCAVYKCSPLHECSHLPPPSEPVSPFVLPIDRSADH